MTKIKAIIFDLDGTLLDTLEDIMDSVNSVLESLGFPLHTIKEYRYFIGDGIEELVKRALPDEEREGSNFKQYLSLVKNEYRKRWYNKTKPYEGIIDMLHFLNKMALKMSIFSNKPHDFTELAVKRYFPEIKFDCVLGAKNGNPRKPDPWGALFIAEKSGYKPEEFIYLGDTKTDILTAKKAGMISAGAIWGFRGKKELKEAGADYLVETPSNFSELIKSLLIYSVKTI